MTPQSTSLDATGTRPGGLPRPRRHAMRHLLYAATALGLLGAATLFYFTATTTADPQVPKQEPNPAR